MSILFSDSLRDHTMRWQVRIWWGTLHEKSGLAPALLGIKSYRLKHLENTMQPAGQQHLEYVAQCNLSDV